MEKVVILGNGISGCTAGIYASRASLEPLLIAGPEPGGQLTLTTNVENFPGFEKGIQGPELINICKKQAEKFGAKFKTGKATGFEKISKGYNLKLEDGSEIITQTLIIATGASARFLGLESEKKFIGKGVHTCATCDAYFYQGKELLVIGGGDSAMEEAMFLSKFAKKVTVVHRRDELKASKIMQNKFMKLKNCAIIWNSTIDEFYGDNFLKGVKLKNVKTKEITDKSIDGVFLAIGHIPNTTMFKGKLDMDEHGYLKTRNTLTNLPGVFASGDVQDTRYRQAITAAGTGCQAAIEAEKYLAEFE